MAEYDHVPGLKEQISRGPYRLSKLVIDSSIKSIEDVERIIRDRPPIEEILNIFRLDGYKSHPAINFKVAV